MHQLEADAAFVRRSEWKILLQTDTGVGCEFLLSVWFVTIHPGYPEMWKIHLKQTGTAPMIGLRRLRIRCSSVLHL